MDGVLAEHVARGGPPVGGSDLVVLDARGPTVQRGVPLAHVAGADGLFAAGDMCEWDSALHGGPARVEHYEVAAAHGRTAARNMLGQDVVHEEVPYFWSDLGDWATSEYVGIAGPDGWDDEVLRGSLDDGAFTVWQLRDGRLVAAMTVGRSDDLDEAKRLIAAGEPVDAAQLGAGPSPPSRRLPQRAQRLGQPDALAEIGERLPRARRVVGQRLEGHQPLAQLAEPERRPLQRQPREPAHGRAVVALVAARRSSAGRSTARRPGRRPAAPAPPRAPGRGCRSSAPAGSASRESRCWSLRTYVRTRPDERQLPLTAGAVVATGRSEPIPSNCDGGRLEAAAGRAGASLGVRMNAPARLWDWAPGLRAPYWMGVLLLGGPLLRRGASSATSSSSPARSRRSSGSRPASASPSCTSAGCASGRAC